MCNSNSKRLLVGTINGLFGVQGWVKIFSHTEPRKNILSYKPWYIQVDGQWQVLEIVSGRAQSKTIVAKIKGIDNREQAGIMMGTDVYIEKTQLPKLAKNEHYWEDLIGLEVISQSGFVFGKVKNLVDTGSNSVLITQGGKKEHWVPYIDPFLIEVDMNKRQIIVDWNENF